jgi:uncharacterized membrane-anchored protein YjiN (DUF445 family)
MGLLGRLILIICDSPVTLNPRRKLLNILEKFHMYTCEHKKNVYTLQLYLVVQAHCLSDVLVQHKVQAHCLSDVLVQHKITNTSFHRLSEHVSTILSQSLTLLLSAEPKKIYIFYHKAHNSIRDWISFQL